MKKSFIVLAFVFLMIPLQSPFAQDLKKDPRKTPEPPKTADASIDLAVPPSPAFTVLGLNPNNVERPSSPRELATSLLNGVDANGNFQTGIAIDFAPYMVFFGEKTTLDYYKNNYYTRFLSRISFSLATAKGATDADHSVRGAIGLGFTPWDEGDSRMDKELIKCLRESVDKVEISYDAELDKIMDERNSLQRQKQIIEHQISAAKKDSKQDSNLIQLLETRKEELGASITKLEEQFNKLNKQGTEELNKKSTVAIDACRKDNKFRSNLWNKSSWSVGIAPAFTSTTGETADLESSGMGIWTSLALGLQDWGQVILHARYRNKEQVPNPDSEGQFFEQDSYRLGGRFRVGWPSISFNAEGLYINENRKNGLDNDEIFRYSFGVEYNLLKDVWFVFNIGSETGNNQGDKLFVLGNLTFAFSPNPTMKFR